ncbi:C2 domain [Trypanosoma vivax]|uniref:Predicted C2 domain protein n=1 Tax=Trypanosoma vivax (strain Y486) TaxID=1055687 RepID=F9WPK7_TRYVY|nr:putative C2 domain protein [Trypanosoma vivax]KAH8611266.1 C2 domain [Trypanosoma vivax]CCD19484.1 predicted C2 domain protein [Trypanosoma vivax Y486]|eukprot:CCD19484.1 predicted C2 domain protein [Trypanosoma vivax Y486]
MATLKVTVHEARDLPVMDRTTGLADPYVVVKLNDLEYATEIVRTSCHPVWNKVFRLDTPDLLVLQEDPLEVRVYDHDVFSRDDIIGHTFVDCNSMMLQCNPSMSGWFPLFDTSMEGIRGEIRLSLQIKFHTAENPLAPRLPTRYVRCLPSLQETEQPSHSDPAQPTGNTSSLIGHTSLEDMEPLRATRMQDPSIMREDEGILIFSAWRLDPSVYRVESMHSMVEELIVKADPEHSRFTNLRSTRATNEARIIQLYKLSGKVRRQLARKAVEMHCNAVLGYVEEFDMEFNGIIARAYGTPCVLSSVKFVDPDKMELVTPLKKKTKKKVNSDGGGMTPLLQLPQCSPPHLPAETDTAHNTPLYLDMGTAQTSEGNQAAVPRTPCLAHYDAVGAAQQKSIEDQTNEKQPQPTATGGRSAVLILTLKDLPSGMLLHVGGLISAMSVKIVAKMKSKQMISQERDAWWIELREELKANARAFHCNAVLGYEESVLYHEDVAVLSLFGTAVMLNVTMHPLRCGPEMLYRGTRERSSSRKACSVLHLHVPGVQMKEALKESGNYFVCGVCKSRMVPEVLLMSCAMPPDLVYDGSLCLVQAVASKAKSAVRGVGLALAVSQALPYIEYSLHKQLLFNLKLQRLNAVFGLRITISISHDIVIGTATGTGCRLIGLPVPSLPRVEIGDPTVRRNEAVMKLEAITSQVVHTPGPRRNTIDNINNPHSSNNSNVKKNLTGSVVKGSPGASASSSECAEHLPSTATWVPSDATDESDGDHDLLSCSKPAKVSNYVVRIDDEEDAEMMLGVFSDLAFEDSLLMTIPYVPDTMNLYGSQECIALNCRFAISSPHGAPPVGVITECFANAKRSYVQRVCRAALRRCGGSTLEQLRVTSFTCDYFFEPNSGELHVRLEGCLMTSTAEQLARIKELEGRSFVECMRRMDGEQWLPALGGGNHKASPLLSGSVTSTSSGVAYARLPAVHGAELKAFRRSNAPYTLPYVFRRNVPLPVWWLSSESSDAPASAPSSVFDVYSDKLTHLNVLERKIEAFTTLVRATFRNMLKLPVRGAQKERAATSASASATALQESAESKRLLHQPMQRLPKDMSTYETSDPVVIFTPQDFVAGQAITRYIGRLSKHFIREDYNIDSSKDLGVFFQQTETEMQCMVQAMVVLMGGNALLKHRVRYHEVWDSDGTGTASLFATVTGDVVLTSSTPFLPV